MQDFSLLMIMIAIVAFIVGMIYPKAFKFILRTKNNRKNIFLLCLGVFIVFCVAMYIFLIGTPVLTSNKLLTNDNQAKITGRGAYANSKVRFYQEDAVLEELQADGKGYFSVDAKLLEGQNKFKADSTNEKGKTQVGGSLIITLDTSAPSLSVEQPQSPVEKNKFTIKGKSEKKAKILIFSGDKEIKSKKLSKDNFEISNIQLSEGENKFTIKAVDEADNFSQPKEIVIIRQKPKPTFSFDEPQNPTESDKFNLKGKAQNSSEVVIYSSDKELKKAKVEKESFEIKDIALNEGENKFTVKAGDGENNYSEAKEIVVIYNKPVAKEEVKPQETPINNLAYNEITSYSIADKTWKVIVFSRKPSQDELIKSSQELHQKDDKAYYHLFDSDEKVEQYKNWDLNYGKVRDKDGVVKKPTDCIDIDYCINLVKNQNIPFPAPDLSWLEQHELGSINQMMADNGLKWQLSKPLGEKISDL